MILNNQPLQNEEISLKKRASDFNQDEQFVPYNPQLEAQENEGRLEGGDPIGPKA